LASDIAFTSTNGSLAHDTTLVLARRNRYARTMALDAALLRGLADHLPDRVSTRPADLEAAARDASSLPGARPDAVVWPLTTGDVVAGVKLAAAHAIPLTARRAATVVTGTGEVLRLGNRARKSASGYHLLGLVVGSEGTLAIVTELTLALAGLPQARRQGGFRFPDSGAAARATAELVRFGVDV